MSHATTPSVPARAVPGAPHPPLLAGRFLAGILPDFRADPLGLFLGAAREHGDVVRLRFGPAITYFFNHPDQVKQILQDNHRNFHKQTYLKQALGIFGSTENIFLSDGDFWLRQRRLMQPAFHRQRIAAFVAMMAAQAEAMLAQWHSRPAGAPLDIEAEMMRLTLGIIGRALFGIDLSDEASELGHAFTVGSEVFAERTRKLFPLPIWVPTPRNRQFLAARRTVFRVIDEIIALRRREGGEHHDLLAMLMEARDEETGTGMDDQQLRYEMQVMLFAGHETTATALTWAFYLLAQHPEVAATLYAELDDVLGGRAVTVDDLPRLPYTRMVVEEAMRLYPPAWAMTRQSVAECEIGGYRVPANSSVMLAPYTTHRHPDFWPEPERFRPERFAPEAVAARPRFAYFPFGGGPRQCIGNTFALTEAQVILATVMQQARLHLVPGHPVRPTPLIALRTSDGLPMTVTWAGDRR